MRAAASSLSHTLLLSNNRFTQFCAWLRLASFRFVSLALHICYQSYFALRRFWLSGRALLSACAFFCVFAVAHALSRSDSRCVGRLRRLRFVVFFHNRFICRIAVILLFRFQLWLLLLLLYGHVAVVAFAACSTLPFAQEFHCNGQSYAACSIMKREKNYFPSIFLAADAKRGDVAILTAHKPIFTAVFLFYLVLVLAAFAF